MVRDKDGYFFDNHWGISGMSRFDHRSFGGSKPVYGHYGFRDNGSAINTIHKFIKHFHKYLPII